MTVRVLASDGKPDWDNLARAYEEARTPAQKQEMFVIICEWIAAELPDDADEVAGAETFLRLRGLM